MIRFRTLGGLKLSGADGSEIQSVLTQPKRVALLAYLCVATPNGFHRRDTLLGLFWPELDAERGRDALNQAVYFLRRELGRDVIVSRGRDDLAVDERLIWCDAAVFEQLLDAERLSEALDLYEGDFLRGLFLSDAEEWERWQEAQRTRLAERAAGGAWALTESAGREGRAAEIARWGRRFLSLSPFDEVRLRRLIELLEAFGDRGGALYLYEEAAERWMKDLDMEPSSQTQALVRRLRSSDHVSGSVRAAIVDDTWPAQHALEIAGVPSPARDVDRATTEGAAASTLRSRRLHDRGFLLGSTFALIVILTVGFFLGSALREGDRSVDQAEVDALRLAVLPLGEHGLPEDDHFLAEVLTDQLIAELTRIEGLSVIAMTSVLPYRTGDREVEEIGRELDVGVILTGHIGRADSLYAISMELVDLIGGERLWGEHFEADVGRLAETQQSIVAWVLRELRLPNSVSVAGSQPTVSSNHAEAYRAYLTGRYFLGKLEGEAFQQARAHFERSLDLDPTFAAAWGGLAISFSQLSSLMALPAHQAYPRSRAAAERALDLDPALGEAHAALAMALTMYYWDSEGAERHFRRALELEPSSVRSRRLYASHLRNLGRFDEALAQIRRARELDPLFAFAHVEEGAILYLARRYDEALETIQQFLRVVPDHQHPYIFMAMAHKQRGEYDEALSALQMSDPEGMRPDAQALYGVIYAQMGRTEDARRMLDVLDRLHREYVPVSAFHKAAIHTALGEYDRAMELLEEAAQQPTWQLRLLKVEPTFDPLRTHPRFDALLAKVGLDE